VLVVVLAALVLLRRGRADRLGVAGLAALVTGAVTGVFGSASEVRP
jgi:hypothetical protein